MSARRLCKDVFLELCAADLSSLLLLSETGPEEAGGGGIQNPEPTDVGRERHEQRARKNSFSFVGFRKSLELVV